MSRFNILILSIIMLIADSCNIKSVLKLYDEVVSDVHFNTVNEESYFKVRHNLIEKFSDDFKVDKGDTLYYIEYFTGGLYQYFSCLYSKNQMTFFIDSSYYKDGRIYWDIIKNSHAYKKEHALFLIKTIKENKTEWLVNEAEKQSSTPQSYVVVTIVIRKNRKDYTFKAIKLKDFHSGYL